MVGTVTVRCDAEVLLLRGMGPWEVPQEAITEAAEASLGVPDRRHRHGWAHGHIQMGGPSAGEAHRRRISALDVGHNVGYAFRSARSGGLPLAALWGRW